MPTPTNTEMETLLRNARAAIDACLQLIASTGTEAGGSAAERSKSTGKEGTAPSQPKGAQFETVRAIFIKEVIERTGYPEEMLELDLDLEGELGIDTVKQVAVLGAVREHFGLDVDKSFKLRDHNTLRKAIDHVAGRLDGNASGSRA